MKTEILLLLSAWDILCFKYIDGNQHYFITPPDRFKNLIKWLKNKEASSNKCV